MWSHWTRTPSRKERHSGCPLLRRGPRRERGGHLQGPTADPELPVGLSEPELTTTLLPPEQPWSTGQAHDPAGEGVCSGQLGKDTQGHGRQQPGWPAEGVTAHVAFTWELRIRESGEAAHLVHLFYSGDGFLCGASHSPLGGRQTPQGGHISAEIGPAFTTTSNTWNLHV